MMRRLTRDRWALASLCVVGVYAAVVLATLLGLLPDRSDQSVGPVYASPSLRFWLGTDFLGRDVLAKVLNGARIAFSVGLTASLIAIPIGAVLGAAAGFFGGRLDDAVVWLYSTFSSVPQILLLTSLSFIMGRGLTAIYAAVGLTSWVGICRIVRAEVLKLKSSDYVTAARALGAGKARLLFRHILPNTTHLVIVDFSLRFVYAIKSEAILSYLGLGVQGQASWGIMISDAKDELIRGIWWQLAGATGAMFLLVLAFNLLSDALRDALDPRAAE
ncbi:MAG: ABC transporter permease [Pseudomonadota bacterium]